MSLGRRGACAAVSLVASALLAGGLAAQDRPAPDSASAHREVLEVLDRMARAMEARDTAALVALFLPGARLVGMRPREGGPVLQTLTAAQFAEFMARDRREK